MKSLKAGNILMCELPALGWFLLQKIPFTWVLPLLIGGAVVWMIPLHRKQNVYLRAFLDIALLLISARLMSFGFSPRAESHPFILLAVACLFLFPRVEEQEWGRVMNWWGLLFLFVFILLLVGTVGNLAKIITLPETEQWIDVLIFYLLAFMPILAEGQESRFAPLLLSLILVPFSLAAYSVLGARGFQISEFPYLSFWSGSTVISFYHLQSLMLAIYYGGALLKISFWRRFFGKGVEIRSSV